MAEPVFSDGGTASVGQHSLTSARSTPFADIEGSRTKNSVSSFTTDSLARDVRSQPAADLGEIVIAFGIDSAFLPHAGVAIASLLDNARGARFRFLIIHAGISPEDQSVLERCAPGHRFEWLQVTDSPLLKMEGKRHISRATYLRLSLPELAPADVKRVLYLDADIVVVSDIRELWTQELGGCLIAGVCDVGIDSEDFARQFGLSPGRLAYFNAGILLLDLEGIRQADMFNTVVELLEVRHEELEQMDQDALNIVFWGKWKKLDPLWNVQRRMVMPQEHKPCFAEKHEMTNGRRPKIIHFTEHNKPWSVDGYHPYIWKYYHYLKRTPYLDAVNKIADAHFKKSIRRRIKTTLLWAWLKP